MEATTVIIPQHEPRSALAKLGVQTQHVEFRRLFLWLVKEVLARCPNLVTITMNRSTHDFSYTPVMQKLVIARGIVVEVRESAPERQQKTYTSKKFLKDREYLLHLPPETEAKLNDLLTIGWMPAEQLVRYFGLRGHKRHSLTELTDLYPGHRSYISKNISSVLHFLNPKRVTAAGALQSSQAIASHLRAYERKKEIERRSQQRNELAKKLHGTSITCQVPLAEKAHVEIIIAARHDGRLEILQKNHTRLYQVLASRYDLEKGETGLRTLAAVGDIFGFSRERARQILKEAFETLSILLSPASHHPPSTTLPTKLASAVSLDTVYKTITALYERHFGPIAASRHGLLPLRARRLIPYLLHMHALWPARQIANYLRKDTSQIHRAKNYVKRFLEPGCNRPNREAFLLKFNALIADLYTPSDSSAAV